MWCGVCERETFATSVHVECELHPLDGYVDFAVLRDNKHFVYENPTPHGVHAGMHMLTFSCRICCKQFKVGDQVWDICISNEFQEISRETWNKMWGFRAKKDQ